MDRRERVRRWFELIAMFVIAPVVLAVFMRGYLVFPAIWTLAAICLVSLLRDPTFDRRQLWNRRGATSGFRAPLISFIMLAPFLVGTLWLYEPERLFSLPMRQPGLWAIIMLAYPLLSVYPQEVAFRAFFVHRFGPLMGRTALIWTSALAFGFAHIIMHNWFAVVASAVGGFLFTLTYLRTRSLLASSLEHALYGCFLFTLGWGWYLYGGSLGK